MGRKCVFCGGRENITMEHVYPNWLSTLFKNAPIGINEVEGDKINRIWRGKVFQHKVGLVCGRCNHGWMSDIENSTKDILTKIIFKYDAQILTKKDQNNISLWVQKTILVINRAIGGGFNIPNSFYEQLFNSNKMPVNNIMVTMGWRVLADGYSKEQPLASYKIKQISSVVVKKDSKNELNAQMDAGGLIWAATLGLGNVIFQIIGTNLNGQVEVGGDMLRIFSQINPYVSDLLWPTEWPIEAVGGLKSVSNGLYGD